MDTGFSKLSSAVCFHKEINNKQKGKQLERSSGLARAKCPNRRNESTALCNLFAIFEFNATNFSFVSGFIKNLGMKRPSKWLLEDNLPSVVK